MRKLTVLAAGLVLLVSGCRAKERPPDVDRLMADLRSDDPQRSGAARLELIRLGEPAVPALSRLLRSGSASERIAAANALWAMGPRARGAVADLALALGDPDATLRLSVAMALQNLGAAAAPAVPALVRALEDRDPAVRQAAVRAIAAVGPGASAALPALTRALKRGSWPEAEEAVRRIRGSDR
ncbi:MAG TPA: HEAT repeat domain-containing protein [Vicinamibacteria bacterium]|nr:HEAT repeat domain-containing protein [Vicinamibacteria bacterium]